MPAEIDNTTVDAPVAVGFTEGGGACKGWLALAGRRGGDRDRGGRLQGGMQGVCSGVAGWCRGVAQG